MVRPGIRTLLFIQTAITVLVILTGCDNSPSEQQDYIETIDEWHEERIRSLEEEDSWLSLAGLYRLKEGENSFGADSANDIAFPGKDVPAKLGTLIMRDNTIRIRIDPESVVQHNGSKVTEMEVASDKEGEPDVFTYKSLRWYVIERRGTYYLRLKDTQHSNYASFDGIERFPVSPEWRLKATFTEFEQPETISIPDILGDVYEDTLYGLLSFEIGGETYELAPLNSPESDRFFIIFGDRTNGDETYGGGRYIYIDTPDEDNTTWIDFNKAYNPPCVFTKYATCPLPPQQNRLPVRITAGEKDYKKKDKS